MCVGYHGLNVQLVAVLDHRTHQRLDFQHRQPLEDYSHLEHWLVQRGQDPQPKGVVRRTLGPRRWLGLLAPRAQGQEAGRKIDTPPNHEWQSGRVEFCCTMCVGPELPGLSPFVSISSAEQAELDE